MDYASIPAEKKAPAIRLLLDSIPVELQEDIRLGHSLLAGFKSDRWWRSPNYRLALMAWKQLLASRGFDAQYFQASLDDVCVPLIEEALQLDKPSIIEV